MLESVKTLRKTDFFASAGLVLRFSMVILHCDWGRGIGGYLYGVGNGVNPAFMYLFLASERIFRASAGSIAICITTA